MDNGYYLFSCSIVKNTTQSAVAMSAYRSGDKLYSLADGETKSYKKRFVEPESFLLKSDNAPEWTLEREKLWNEVERFEDRDNAQLARNILVALPNDLTNEQQLELTKEYVQENFVDDGMVADVSIHRDDVNNPHAHILLTTRQFDQEGNWEKGKSKRVPKLDEQGNQIYNDKGWKETRSVKINDWDKRKTLNKWRENWSEKLNEKSLKYDLGKTYSDKSFEEQGRLEKAGIRLTRSEYQFEEKEKNQAEQGNKEYKPTTYYAQKNNEVKQYNEQFKDVIHLEDYKQKKDYKAHFDDLRNKSHVNKENVQATKLLVNRVKGYVDYQTSKNLYNDFTNERNKWKLKLERDKTLNESTKKLYSQLVDKSKDDPEVVKNFGYSVENFKEEMQKDLEDIQASEQKNHEEYEKFNELKQATITSLDYQQNLLDTEFSSVYSNVNIEDYSYDEKYFAMKLLKDHNILLPDDKIKDEFKSQEKDKDYNKQFVPVWKQAKDTITSIDIYNRTINKLRRADSNKLTPDELKDTIIKTSSFDELKANYQGYLQDISPIINNEIEKISGNDVLNNSSMRVKVAVLEEHSKLDEAEKENLNVEEFINDVQQKHEKESDYLNEQSLNSDNEEKQDIYKENAKGSKEITDGLFNVLNSIIQDRNASNERGKKDRTKVSRKRGTDGREL